LSNEEKRMIMKIWKRNDLCENLKKKEGSKEKGGGGGNEIHAQCACAFGRLQIVAVIFVNILGSCQIFPIPFIRK
jgi:hypothetical protein